MDIRIDTDDKRIKRGDPAKSAWNNSAERYDKSAAQELSFSGLDAPKKKNKPKQPQKLMETPIRRESVRREPVREQHEPVRRAPQPRPEKPQPKQQERPHREQRSVPQETAVEIPIMTAEEAAEYAAQREKRRRITTRISVIAAIVFVIGILAFLVYRFVRIEHITVSGNDELSAEYITELSGLQMGEHIFTIDMDALKSSFARDARVEYLDMEFTFPNSVELQIKECLPVAKFALSDGGYLLIDNSGKAVDEKQEIREHILIEGLAITDYSIGYPIRTGDTYKQSILCELLTALCKADYDGEIDRLEINVITNIKLYNHAGMEIRFGDSENLDLKIKWTKAVVENLAQRGIKEGIVDVYSEDKAIYAQPETQSASNDVELNYLDIHYDDLDEQTEDYETSEEAD